jgi:hypothetical protein
VDEHGIDVLAYAAVAVRQRELVGGVVPLLGRSLGEAEVGRYGAGVLVVDVLALRRGANATVVRLVPVARDDRAAPKRERRGSR